MKEEDESGSFKLKEKIPFQYVSYSMYLNLANKLDPDGTVVGNNWRLLAEKLGYSTQDIFVFESQQTQHGRNTIKVLMDYNQKQGSTVNDVYRALEDIDRPDALDELISGLPEIEKSYQESLKKKHRHQDLIENEYRCTSCDDMAYSSETFQSYSQSHHKAMMSPGHTLGFSRNQQMPVASLGKNYQRHKSFDPQCVNSRLPGYEHESPDFKRQRSMPVSDSMMVRGHNSHSQYYGEMEPMDQSPSVREDPVPPGVALMRGMPRYNNHHGLQQMNSRIHTKDSEALFRQPFSQFGRQTERAGLKLEIPSPSEIYNRQRSADFYSPSPTPTTPSTPLGHLQKLVANERQFQPEDGYKDLMKLKHDEELLQGKAGHLESPDRMMEIMSHQNSGMVSPGHLMESHGHMKLSPRISGPPNTFPLRLKSSSNSSSTSPTGSCQQLTKSHSVPGNMKPAEFRKAFRHIKVFVTYAADDKKHTQRVLSLCKCLEKNGFTCCVDIFHRKLPVEERHNWYQNRFEEADFILVVMSPKYRMEADSCEMENDADDSDSVDSDGENDLNNRPYRLHTKNIYRLMYREYVHQSGARCMRFVPLIFPGMPQDIIPAWMLDNYNGLFYNWPKQYKDLLWMLTKPENRVPEHITPPISRCVQDESSITNSTETNDSD